MDGTLGELDLWTPAHRAAHYYIRHDTCDHNNVWSACEEDEYGLRDVTLGSGVAIDVGAHIGGVTIPLALDNPEATIIAVEPVPPNVELLRQNLQRNGLADRVKVLVGAVGEPGTSKAQVKWDFGPSESAQHHRFIGNITNIPYDDCQTADCDVFDMEALYAAAGGPIAYMKIDCEGGEYQLFKGDMSRTGTIRGEYHASWRRLERLLERTHVVTQLPGSTDTFGNFRAEPRGSA